MTASAASLEWKGSIALKRAFLGRLSAVEHYLAQAHHLARPLPRMAALRRNAALMREQCPEESRIAIVTQNIEGALRLLRVVAREAKDVLDPLPGPGHLRSVRP